VSWTFASHAWPAQAREPVARTSKASEAFTIDGHTLSWPRGTAQLKVPHVAFWGGHAVVVEARALVVFDAERATPTRLELAELVFVPQRVAIVERMLHVTSAFGTMRVPLDDLEQLVDGELEISIETVYPLRNPNARVRAIVAAIVGDQALVNVGRTQLQLDHRQYGLERGMEVALVDELWPGGFVAIDVPNRPRQIVIEPLLPYTVSAKVSAGKAEALPTKPLARRPELDTLIHEINAHPEDDHDRAVLIDLLADLGEPCAALFAQARAGRPIGRAKRVTAFGPLASVFSSIELVGGLPETATLARGATPDQLRAVLGDARIGLVRRLRLSNGSRTKYKQLLASRALVGLRAIDAPDAAVLTAALQGGHALTHLYEVGLHDRFVSSVLSQHDFDSVRYLDLPVGYTWAAELVTRIIADSDGIFARVPRHLVFREPHDMSLVLGRSVFGAFASFAPHTTISVHGVTLRREANQIVASFDADEGEPLMLPLLEEVLPEAHLR